MCKTGFMIIQTQEQLVDICAQLSQKPYITIDTEFLREKTYYAKLCLIQLAAEGIEPVAVDPIEYDLDMTPLNDLLHNENVLKVFHAARQDLEIFYQLNDQVPAPLFDTQVAAMVCGYGDSISYANLVRDITGEQIPKSAQFTDWSRRPLTDKQIDYALKDVDHLRDVYISLSKQLDKKNRTNWVKEEMAILSAAETYKVNPDESWKRIKIRSHESKTLNILKHLAAWREERALAKDLPRSFIIKDETIAGIALYVPKDKKALSRVRGLPPSFTRGHQADTVINIIQKALKTDKGTWPVQKQGDIFPKEMAPHLEILKLLLKVNCSDNNVATKLVSDKKDLERIIMDDHPDVPAMKGWRFEVFGKDAQAVKEGKLAIGLKDGQLYKFSTNE